MGEAEPDCCLDIMSIDRVFDDAGLPERIARWFRHLWWDLKHRRKISEGLIISPEDTSSTEEHIYITMKHGGSWVVSGMLTYSEERGWYVKPVDPVIPNGEGAA